MLQDDIQKFNEMASGLTPAQINADNKKRIELAQAEYARFEKAHKKNMCYICGKSYKTISHDNPCVHWLLRECKFRKKDFQQLYKQFDFFQINAFLRWIANSESFAKNINDMKDEQTHGKVIQETIKWKHIDWSFECALNDFKGHDGRQSNFPHYHFQMRINGQQFINFNDFHIPLTQGDQLKLELMKNSNFQLKHTFGPHGAGMEDMIQLPIEEFFESADFRGDELNGIFHFQSIISAPNGIDGGDIEDAYEESRKTGKSVAKILREKFADDDSVSIVSIGSPSENIPEIAKRTEHKKTWKK